MHVEFRAARKDVQDIGIAECLGVIDHIGDMLGVVDVCHVQVSVGVSGFVAHHIFCPQAVALYDLFAFLDTGIIAKEDILCPFLVSEIIFAAFMRAKEYSSAEIL